MRFLFEDLEVYKKSHTFVTDVYQSTKNFPKDEIFGITNQLKRAAVSICINLAEGSSRKPKEFSRYIDISRGSIFECAAILEICYNQKFIAKHELDLLKCNLVELSKMLSGLQKSVTGSGPRRNT